VGHCTGRAAVGAQLCEDVSSSQHTILSIALRVRHRIMLLCALPGHFPALQRRQPGEGLAVVVAVGVRWTRGKTGGLDRAGG